MLFEELSKKQISNTTSQYPSLVVGSKVDTIISNTELVNLGNQSWQAICNRRNAQTMASIDIKLYYKNKNNKKLLTAKSITKQQKTHLKITKKEYDNVEEIVEHPILDLLNGNDYSYSELIEFIALYLGSLGVAYVRINKNKNQLLGLEPLLAEYITPIVEGYGITTPNEGKIIAYKYQTQYKNEVIQAEDIIEFVNYNPGNKILGKGDLEICLNAAIRHKYYDEYEQYVAKNNGRPDFLITTKNNIKEEEAKAWYKVFLNKFRGLNNSGKPIFLSGDYKIDILNFKPNELNFIQGREEARDTICAAYGVPKSFITTNDVNRSNAYAGLEQYARFTIYPKLSKIIEVLNYQLVSKFDKNLYLWFDELKLSDSELIAERTLKQVQAGIITIDEAREILGYDKLEELEDPKDPKEDMGEDINEE